jgi:hypothetical protein
MAWASGAPGRRSRSSSALKKVPSTMRQSAASSSARVALSIDLRPGTNARRRPLLRSVVAQEGWQPRRDREEPRLEEAVPIDPHWRVEGGRTPGRFEQPPGGVVVEERVAHPARGDDPIREGLAQHEQAQHVIEIGTRQQDRIERYVAGARAGVQSRKARELLSDVGAGVHDGPPAAVGGDRDRGLGARAGTSASPARARTE